MVTLDSSRAAGLLIAAMRELSRARDPLAIAQVVKTTARELVGADGATFVLRDSGQCFYLDEDAISPLWKGQRFPMDACVSGWVMTHAEQVAMSDIYVDPRVPHEAYRPTFVKSLVMTPVRRVEPVAAIGIYWAEAHHATDEELRLLQDLADTTAVALENAQVYAELERRVFVRTEQLIRANQELDAFAQTVAHDLRSPLSAIIGFAELMQENGAMLSAELRASFVAEIATSGRRMNALISALLEFARTKRCELHRRTVDLTAVAHRVAAQLRTEGASSRVELTIAEGLHAYADEALIEVVLSNLLSNAFKYSSRSEPPRIAFEQADGPEGCRSFVVRDNGTGFEPAAAARLFAPFQRLHSEGEFPGHGVGLATVAAIVERHGGRVWADGQLAAGARFYFALPSRSAAQQPGAELTLEAREA